MRSFEFSEPARIIRRDAVLIEVLFVSAAWILNPLILYTTGFKLPLDLILVMCVVESIAFGFFGLVIIATKVMNRSYKLNDLKIMRRFRINKMFQAGAGI